MFSSCTVNGYYPHFPQPTHPLCPCVRMFVCAGNSQTINQIGVIFPHELSICGSALICIGTLDNVLGIFWQCLVLALWARV